MVIGVRLVHIWFLKGSEMERERILRIHRAGSQGIQGFR